MATRVLLASSAFVKPKPSQRSNVSSICRETISVTLHRRPFSCPSRSLRCKAVREGSQPQSYGDDRTVYQGTYGPWTVDPADVREVPILANADANFLAEVAGLQQFNPTSQKICALGVILYRSGLVTAAASFVIACSSAFLSEGTFLNDLIKRDIDLLYVLGAGGLGLSLYLIHIYVTPIKRALQALWVIGVVGSFATYLNLALPDGESLTQYVIDNPIAVWFVGPLFAALTGLVFKEGLCYGKLEAGILTFIIPSLLLGHLSGLMDDNVKLSLLGVWMALFVIFASRKFTQPIKDDIGDKSIFMFNALPEDKKQVLIEKLERQAGQELN